MSEPGALLAVLGNPVAHSLSPVMHEAALARTGRSGRYIACAVTPERLAVALDGMAALGFIGCNITVGLKEAACRLAGERSAAAAWTGAANTLRFDPGGRVFADTTDGRGLLVSLEQDAAWTPAGRAVVLLGAGGAARGVAAALAAGGADVGVYNRTAERAVRLAADLGSAVYALEPGGLAAALARAALLVNCTTSGMGGGGMPVTPEALRCLPADALVCDIVYTPEQTPLLVAASGLGLRVLGGLGMLAWQAALSWEVWFGVRGPADVMAAAAREELRLRSATMEGSTVEREKDQRR